MSDLPLWLTIVMIIIVILSTFVWALVTSGLWPRKKKVWWQDKFQQNEKEATMHKTKKKAKRG